MTFSAQANSQDGNATRRPNVLLIVADDLGWRDVGYHQSEIKTPMIDQLAKEGVELHRFYVQPTCSPTRSSLMTGKNATSLGFQAPIGKNNVKGLPLSEKIMPEYFKESGYVTSLIGKWHLGRYKKEYWPTNRGFDHFYGSLNGGIGHYDHVHGGGLDWERNGKAIREEGYSTHLLTKEAIAQITQHYQSNEPFFIELCYAAPHLPNEAPESSIEKYQHLPDPNRQKHAAMISEIDQGIKQIHQTLKELDLLDHTIIWFMSDNGGESKAGTPKEMRKRLEQLVEVFGKPIPIPFFEFLRSNIENGASDNHPFKGGKYSLKEGGIRVPSFIYAPEILPSQKVKERLSVNDVLPTLLDLISFSKTIDEMDGKSYFPFLKGSTPAPQNSFLVENRLGISYLSGQWKLIIPANSEPQLYDIMHDSLESYNLASEYPEVVEQLFEEQNRVPRGENVSDPLWTVAIDPDFFGGEEDRPPFAGVEGKVAGRFHPIILLIAFIFLIVLAVILLFLRYAFKKITAKYTLILVRQKPKEL